MLSHLQPYRFKNATLRLAIGGTVMRTSGRIVINTALTGHKVAGLKFKVIGLMSQVRNYCRRAYRNRSMAQDSAAHVCPRGSGCSPLWLPLFAAEPVPSR